MARWPAVVIALSFVVMGVAVPAGSATAASPGLALNPAQEFDRVQFRIAVHANGSAQWTFHYERTLDNASERDRFEAFAADFNRNVTPLYRDFRNQSLALADRGQSATGREMAVDGFDRRAFVTTGLNDVGVVEMAFTWRGFARTDGDRVIVGDVFEGGLYVGPSQALVVRAIGDLEFRSVEPDGTLSGGTLEASDTVTWSGERTFADNHPRVVLAPPGAPPVTTTTGDGTDGVSPGDGTPTDSTAGTAPLWPVGLVLAVVLAALAVFAYRRRSGGPTPVTRGGGGPSSGPAVEDTELLDDEERIARLLEEAGGRMRQSAIVEETGWSKSKVSMVLSEMTDEDTVRKLRVGRENIISLPGHEPEAARSSLDEDEDNRPE